jgi:cytidyltransferase-like protein
MKEALTNEIDSINLLNEISDHFEIAKMISWIDFRTLLNAYRLQSISAANCALCLCVISKDRISVERVLDKLRAEKKLFSIDSDDERKGCVTLRYGAQNSIVNIFICEEQGNKVVPNGAQECAFHKFFIDELELLPLGEKRLKCPRHLTEFLTLRYGANYMMLPQDTKSDLYQDGVTRNLGTIKSPVVAYTSGVYDLFHFGHLNLFKRMKERFDKVVVGVHIDEEVETYKQKPTIPYQQRIDIVRACRYVDEVYESAELVTSDATLAKVGAHYVVAGRDPSSHIHKFYTVHPERLHLIERTPGISSRELRKNISTSP